MDDSRRLIPGAVITDRTARDPKLPPVEEHAFIFCVRDGRRRRINLPRLTIVARPGAPAQPDDAPFHGGTYLASEPRALLENARRTAASKDAPASTLSRAELDDWVAHLATVRGSDRLRTMRKRVRELAIELVLPDENDLIDRLLGAALGAQGVDTDSNALSAHIHNRAFDQVRVELFEAIVNDLVALGPHIVPAPVDGSERIRLLSFFEAWFSNYIEGTESLSMKLAALSSMTRCRWVIPLPMLVMCAAPFRSSMTNVRWRHGRLPQAISLNRCGLVIGW